MPPSAASALAWALPCPLHGRLGRVCDSARGVASPRRPARRSVPRRLRASCSVEHPPKRKPADAAMSTGARDGGWANAGLPISKKAVPENNAVARDFVRLENISHSYGGRKILDGLNLSLRYGEATAIIGPSGTG